MFPNWFPFRYIFIPQKAKGVSHLIEVSNPNHVVEKVKKVSELEVGAKAQLSRKER